MTPIEPTVRLQDINADKALLEQLSAGRESAFAAIYGKYWRMVYHVADRFLQSSVQAEDVVQEVFSTIWTQREDLGKVENLQAFIRVMARNRIYSEFRAWSKERRHMEGYLSQTETSVNDSDFAILNEQNEQLLEEILNSLPPRQKEVFVLARTEGLTHEKIAERLNVSPGTVKNHMVRALQSIRTQVGHHVSVKITCLLAFLFS